MPESVLKILRDKDKELCARMYKEALPDKEALEIFNIQIIPGYFVWNEYYAGFRE